MYIDLAACSMNPSIFDAPRDFRPERWDDPQLRHSFMPFAMGPRSCIGRRFAEVEMLSFVCALVKMFKITPVALAGETEGEVRKRYMTTKEKLTIGSLSWDVRLEKREGAVDAGEQSG
jgi:cytochrome P450